ncbi:helix-turn-helix transcriptional regulator [Ruegeria denitrificans]|uniref:helix-turn-helix transcriptional regulator n=1 Tax=Ruegeria denitrificans TaxID=1715692 RepID=UPI00071CD222|nr:helix-turn-helix transcriptional regulator [Ruegeria denitrificans]
MPKPLPVASVPFLASIAAPLQTAGSPVTRHLEACGLPGGVLDVRDGLVSELALWDFEECAARKEGFEHLGYVASTDLIEAGTLCGHRLPFARTVGELLCEFAKWITSHSNYAAHSVQFTASGAWYNFDNRRLTISLPWQVEQYIIGMITALVRTASPDWKPARLRLTNPKPWHQVPKDWENAKTDWDARLTGVFLSNDTMSTPVVLPLHGDAIVSPDACASDAFEHVLKSHVLGGNASLDAVAHSFRMSPRTLQRLLAAKGGRFRSLKSVVSMRIARDLLYNHNQTVKEVSYRLGYSSVADFSKAYKRHYGVSPSLDRISG